MELSDKIRAAGFRMHLFERGGEKGVYWHDGEFYAESFISENYLELIADANQKIIEVVKKACREGEKRVRYTRLIK